MKRSIVWMVVGLSFGAALFSCGGGSSGGSTDGGGMSAVKDEQSEKDIVKIAKGSKDHSTLYTALEKADLLDAMSNPGPFTVFAPTNAAFDKLPKGTVDDLLKPSKKGDLQNILYYHVIVGNMTESMFQDGQSVTMFSGEPVTVSVKNGKITLNNSAHVVAAVKASNGWVYIVDNVLLPPKK